MAIPQIGQYVSVIGEGVSRVVERIENGRVHLEGDIGSYAFNSVTPSRLFQESWGEVLVQGSWDDGRSPVIANHHVKG